MTFIYKILNSEILRLLVLTALVSYTYQSFFNGYDLGSTDAWYYHNLLRDALDQIDHGTFPVYIGQGLFNFFGTTVSLAPYYLLLGEFIHLTTFMQLNSLYIQHFIILFSAFAGAFVTYFLLNKINSSHRWVAMSLAFFYISCPGIISLIYSLDMYYSFTTLPFIPLLFYGMIRNHQKNDICSLLIISTSLSLLWLAHSPIAEWCTIILFLFFSIQILLNKSKFIQLVIILSLFFLLNLWFFMTIFNLDSQNAYIANPHTDHFQFAAIVIKILRAQIPEVFLPLSPSIKALSFLQLGYTLWFLLIANFAIFLVKQRDILIGIFLIIISMFIIMLFPPPFIGFLLWSHLPGFLNLVNAYPMERLYIILASFICIITFLSINYIAAYIERFFKTSILIFLIMISWNIHEINYFKTNFLIHSSSKNFLNTNNQFLFPYTRQPIFKKLFHGHYDPLLKNKLLDKQQHVVKRFDLEQNLTLKCLAHQIPLSEPKLSSGFNLEPGKMIELSQFNIKTKQKYLICLTGNFSLQSFLLEVYGNEFNATSLSIPFMPLKETNTVFLPLFTDQHGDNLKLIIDPHMKGTLKISSLGIIPYDDKKLPMMIESYIPFKITINANEAGYFLELFKQYLPGYEASVNGKKVTVLTSPNQFVMIPLTKGVNHVVLSYKGTFLMQLSFYISLSIWVLLLSYFIHRYYHQLKLSRLNTVVA